MKYSMKCLDKALLLILPDSDQWPNSIQRPTRLDMAAKELFMYPFKYSLDIKEFEISTIVIRTAMIELSTDGWMTFGTVDDFGSFSTSSLPWDEE